VATLFTQPLTIILCARESICSAANEAVPSRDYFRPSFDCYCCDVLVREEARLAHRNRNSISDSDERSVVPTPNDAESNSVPNRFFGISAYSSAHPQPNSLG
jgi:hypothetical protein